MLNGKKVAVYVRVGNKNDLSVDNQKKCLTEYCQNKKLEQYEFYIDNGYSGNNLERPAIQKLIEDASEEKLSHCIVYELSRLSRSTKDTLHVINDFLIPNGVNFISLIDSLDTSTSLGKHIINVSTVMDSTKRGITICQKTKR